MMQKIVKLLLNKNKVVDIYYQFNLQTILINLFAMKNVILN